jgi:dihydrofolate reductase
MRRVVVHMQSTLNGCIANAQGTFWQPFPSGDPEQAHINEVFRAADTIVLSRVMYEAIVPWWEIVAAGQVPDDVPEVRATFKSSPASCPGSVRSSSPAPGPPPTSGR